MRIHTVPLNLGDLMGGTSRMDALEFGAYTLLFLNCYQDGEHCLPKENERIRRIARVTPKQWKKIGDVVMKKFTSTESGWRHKKVDEVVEKLTRLSSKNRDNSLKRWETGMPVAMPKPSEPSQGVASKAQSQEEFNLKPEDTNQPKKKYSDNFEKLWKMWPVERRCEQPKALAAWKEAIRKLPEEKIIECVARYLVSKQAKEGYAPYPARWLKYERWLEVMEEKDGLSKADIIIDDLGDDNEDNQGLFDILMSLKKSQGEAIFRSWLSQLRIIGRAHDALGLSVPTRFMAEWIKTHYAAELQKAVNKKWPAIKTIEIKQQQEKQNG